MVYISNNKKCGHFIDACAIVVHHIKEVGARLSSHLWYAWRDRVFNIKRKNKGYATFDEFVEFVTEKADEATR